VKVYEADHVTVPIVSEDSEEYIAARDLPKLIEQTRKEMKAAAAALDFEQAAELRDRVQDLERRALGLPGEAAAAPPAAAETPASPTKKPAARGRPKRAAPRGANSQIQINAIPTPDVTEGM